MRRLFLVTYDISDAKRLRKVFRVMRNHGAALQYSVFRCELSALECVGLKAALTAVMEPAEDRVMLADLGPADGKGVGRVDWLGRPPQEPDGAGGTSGVAARVL